MLDVTRGNTVEFEIKNRYNVTRQNLNAVPP